MSNLHVGIFEADLPPSLKEMCELIGVQATFKLAQRFGGRRLYVPEKFEQWEAIKVIGHDAAETLWKHYAGLQPYVAKAQEAGRVVRNLEIVRRYDAGVSVSALVVDYNLSERQIRAILSTPLPDRSTDQLRLL